MFSRVPDQRPLHALSLEEAVTKLGRGEFLAKACAAALLLAITGCAKHSPDHFTVGAVEGDYKTRHPIVLQEQEQTLDIPLASTAADLPLASKSAVRGFSMSFLRSAAGTMTIMLPSGSPNERAARSVRNNIVGEMTRAGIPSNRIATVTYYAHEHGAAAPIRLSYGAINASVTGCGKWKADLSDNSENRNYHNFGCASQNNLAAIISNPADLIGPRGTTGIDAARRAKVIDDYRKGEETNTRDESYTTIGSVFE